MAFINIKFDTRKIEKALRSAIEKGLASDILKAQVTTLTVIEIEKVVEDNQDLFRPDRGSDGGNDLVGLLGIGQGGSPLVEKYAGRNAAWTLLNPGVNQFAGAAKLTASFRRARSGSFANLTYTIDIDRFFNNFKSTYLSRKRGDADFTISWMQGLIDGIPTEQLRVNQAGDTDFVFVNSGPNFNPEFSRTGLGLMVPSSRLRIPTSQFTFNGRGRNNTFGVLLEKLQDKLSSNRFKSKIEKIVADRINSGGR